MSDQWTDVDLLLLDQAQSARVNYRTSIRFKTTRRTRRTHQHRLLEKYAAEHAHVRARMSMPVKQHGRLLANQSRNATKDCAGTGSFDQILDAFAAGVFPHRFDDILANIYRFAGPEIFRQRPFAFIRIADDQQAFVAEHVS